MVLCNHIIARMHYNNSGIVANLMLYGSLYINLIDENENKFKYNIIILYMS